MNEAQEKDMDAVASFKCGKSLTIADPQVNIVSQIQSRNLLVSSNRYGYVFYATEDDGLAIISSSYIDLQSKYLTRTAEDDDDDATNDETTNENTSIFYRPYIPGQPLNKKNSSLLPVWIALNADESILAIILSQIDTKSWLIIFYDVVKLIQMSDSTPICSPCRLPSDTIGDTIQNFSWNPAMPNVFAFIDGLGVVSVYEVDIPTKQWKPLGRSQGNNDYSSICWSPKGKQLVVVTYEGALHLYESDMKLKKSYPSTTGDGTYPPCISVQWLSNYQFLLGYSENSPDENSNDPPYFHLLLTFDKDPNRQAQVQIYNDLFFDYDEASPDINPQYFYIRLNETKIIITGLTKSLKINVLGSDELNQDSLDIWSFADQSRATVKGLSTNDDERPILTGMALGLNSTLQFREGNKKLPPCPVVYLANSDGVLQVYYFIHKTLQSIYRRAELIKPSQTSQSSTAVPKNGFGFTNFGQASVTTTNLNQTTTKSTNNTFGLNSQIPASINSQPGAFSFSSQVSAPVSNPSNIFNSNQQAPAPVSNQSNTFSFNKQTVASVNSQSNASGISSQVSAPVSNQLNSFSFNQPVSTSASNQSNTPNLNTSTTSSFNNLSKTVPPSVQQSTINTITTNQQQQQQQSSQVDNKRLLQIINDFQSRLQSVQKPISKPSETTVDIENLFKTVQDMNKTVQTSIQSIKSMTNEHIESMTKLGDASHRIKLSQKENLYHFLRDRELDPWTQSRLDTIKTKYDRIKTNLNLLLQITHTTIHDRSNNHNNNDNDDDQNNEDFLPELELSINTNETMKQRLQKRIRDLSHQVTETERDLDNICSKLNSDILSSTTFNKTTLTSASSSSSSKATTNQTFHELDADILSYLRTNHPKIQQVQVQPPTMININSTSEQKKSTITEIPKPTTPLLQQQLQQQQPSTPKLVESPIAESEGFKNMLRLVRTSIDLFSGTTSPDQLQELSNTIATSPLSSVQKSNTINLNRTPTLPKPTMITKTTTNNKPLQTQSSLPTTNLIQTPAKTIASSVPSISVTPPTPANQTVTSNTTAFKPQTNKPIVQTPADLNRTQVISSTGDSTIRSLLDGTISQMPTGTSVSNQSVFGIAQNQTSKAPTPGTTSVPSTIPASIAVAPVQLVFGAQTSPATTVTTVVQSTTPTTKPIVSTGASSFGIKPAFGGPAFDLTPTTSSGIGFGTATTAATTSAPLSNPFGSGFGAALSITTTATTTTTSTTSANAFGSTTTTTTTSAPSTGIFGTPATSTSSPFGGTFSSPTTATSTAPTTNIFGNAPTTTAAPTASIFGGSAPTTVASSPFGSGFGGATSTATTSASNTGAFSSPFASNSTTSTSPFGNTFGATTSAPTASPFGGFGSTTSSAPTSTTSTSVFGGFGAPASAAPASTTTTSVFGGFGAPASSAPASTTTTSVFGGFGAPASSAPASTTTTSVFGGFGSAPTSTATTSVFGSSGTSSVFGAASPTASATSPAFGGAPVFGGTFSGFNTQSGSSAPTSGFKFGGFGGGQAADASKPASFSSFGSPTSSAQPASPFGGSSFGATPTGQPSAFGGGASAFGTSTAQPASSSFTSYRK